MTFQEIKEKIEEMEISVQDLFWLDSVYENLEKEFGDIEQTYSSNTADGQEMFVIHHFAEHGVFIRVNGWYSSWGDCEFDSYEQVFPYQKTIQIFCANDEEFEKFKY